MSLITARLDRFTAPEPRTMAVCSGAHLLHDGFTDLLYVLPPLWQAQFGLGYAEVGLLRAFYVGAIAGFQVPHRIDCRALGGDRWSWASARHLSGSATSSPGRASAS